MFGMMDISTSALVAQRTRLDAIASNIANISTTHNEAGQPEPYQPRFTVFQTDDSIKAPLGAVGVRVESVQIADVEPNWKYQPGHPDAIKEGEHAGCVAYPGVNMMAEFTDALEATRAYEANIGVIEVSKEITQQSLRIVA